MFEIDFLYGLLTSIGLGFMIGMERELTGHSTGIRTGVLVCVGACLFTSFPVHIAGGDVSRAAAQITTGVGFLGSGIIFKDGSNVRGLNTAATIWCTAAVGVFAGAGLYLYALTATCCLLLINTIFRLIHRSRFAWNCYENMGTAYRLSLCCSVQDAEKIRNDLIDSLKDGQHYVFYVNTRQHTDAAVRLTIKFFCEGRADMFSDEQIEKKLAGYPTLREIEWEKLD